MGDCYGMYEDGELTAGYCLVRAPIHKLRSIQQIPKVEYYYYGNPKLKRVSEFTGYFIENRAHSSIRGVIFTMHLVWKVLVNSADMFVYSYPVSSFALKEYYGYGRPWRLYKGMPNPLEGHNGNMEPEYVEVLTKWGIIKIFLKRTFQIARYQFLRSNLWRNIKKRF